MNSPDFLDVVNCLSSAQENLRTLAGRGRPPLVVGLPSPALCAALHPMAAAALRAVRRQSLQACAEEEGGGDGPAPILDLDEDDRSLEQLLASIRRERTRELVLYAARDQPGIARAFRLRAGAAIRNANPRHRSMLEQLMGATAPIVDLGGGVYLTRSGVTPPADACWCLVGYDAGEPLPAPSGSADFFARDPALTLAPWSGLLPPTATRATALDVREPWLQYWAGRDKLALTVAAALGIDTQLERLLWRRRPSPARETMAGAPLLVAITGIDGSGKSTQAALLTEALRRRGYSAAAVKIYRHGSFLEVADELGARTIGGGPLGCFRVSRQLKIVDSLFALRALVAWARREGVQVLVCDRYLETHIGAARSQLGWDLDGHPAFAALPEALATFLLRLPADVALRRLDERGGPRTADEHRVGLLGYEREFARFVDDHPQRCTTLDATLPRETLAETIETKVLPLLPTRPGTEPAGAPPAPPHNRGRSRLQSERVNLIIGGGRRRDCLGGRLLDLCRQLQDEKAGFAAFTESFWLETYAAQLIVDAREHGGGEEPAWVPLWPLALRRLDCFADVTILDELDRVLLANAEVVGYRANDSAADLALRTLFPDAFGLPRAYRRALEELAQEQRWPCFDVDGRSQGPSAELHATEGPTAAVGHDRA